MRICITVHYTFEQLRRIMVNGTWSQVGLSLPRLSLSVLCCILHSRPLTHHSFLVCSAPAYLQVLTLCKMLCLEACEFKRYVRHGTCPQSIDSEEGSDMVICENILDSVTKEIQDMRSGRERRNMCPVPFVCVTFNSLCFSFLTCKLEIIKVFNFVF